MKLLLKILLFFIIFNSNISFAKYSYYTTEQEDSNTETLILFDSSGSMSEKLQNRTRIEHAADAVFNILNNLPDKHKIGLRTIGVHPSKIPTLLKAGREQICKQTYLRAPIRSFNDPVILDSLKELYPFGPTPLAYALRLVVENDFQHYTPHKHIILITDGFESCGGNPCEYIKHIMTERKDITIDVIAIGANKYDLGFLGCLTDATGGRVYDVQRPSEIQPVISEITKKSQPKVQQDEQNTQKPKYRIINEQKKPIIKKTNIQYKNYLLEFYD